MFGFIKSIFGSIFESVLPLNVNLIHESVPTNRSSCCAYVLLQDKYTKNQKGAYVQAFYQLAKEESLQCQIMEREFIDRKKSINPGYIYQDRDFKNESLESAAFHKQLYRKRPNGSFVKKNAFELACISAIHHDDILAKIGKEFNYHNRDGLLPQPVSKIQMMSEYLAWLDKTNLEIVPNSVAGVPILIMNPLAQQKDSEKLLHTMMQILGLFVAVSAFATFVVATTPVAAIASLYAMSPILTIVLSSIVAYSLVQTMHLSQFFGLSDLAEFIWNDIRALTSKHFTHSKSPFSWKKTIKSACTALAIGALAYVGAEGVFFGILAWPVVASLGMGACAIAGTLAALSFVGTCIGVLGPVRYMNGFGMRNNKIDPNIINSSIIPDVKESKLPPSPTVAAPTRVERLKKETRALKAENAGLKSRSYSHIRAPYCPRPHRRAY